MSAHVFYIKQNDRRPKLQVQLQNSDGTPLDLTSSANTKFTMKKQGAATKLDNQVAAVTDAANGLVEYEWQAGDTDTLGTYRGEFTVTWTTGVTQTFPEDDYIKVVVIDDLA